MNKITEKDKLYIKQVVKNHTDKITVLCKCLIGEKKSLSVIWKLFYSTIGYISSLYAFSVLIKDLVGFDKVEIWLKGHLIILVAVGVIASLIHNHGKTSCRGTIEDDDLQIVATVKDLFGINASSYVIPTNTFFRTIMDGEYISSQSVQGAFQLRYFRNKLDKLEEAIENSLLLQRKAFENSSDIHGAVKKYPIGSVAKVDYMNKHYYFVAISDVNEYGKPINQSYENVEIALKGLFSTINELGHCDDLVMPLIGTGRAAIREATMEKVFENIVEQFIDADKKMVRKLIISIRPKDYLEERIDMKKVEKYMNYKCEFK